MTKRIEWEKAKLIIDEAFKVPRVDDKCIVLDSCNTVETQCRDLEVGHIVWFPKTMVLLDATRAGPWKIKRIWNWDRDSRQIRFVSAFDPTKNLAECIRKDVLFYRIDIIGA